MWIMDLMYTGRDAAVYLPPTLISCQPLPFTSIFYLQYTVQRRRMVEGSSKDGREMIGTTLCEHRENIGSTPKQHRVCNGTARDLPAINKGFAMLLPVDRGAGLTKSSSPSLLTAPCLSIFGLPAALLNATAWLNSI